MSSNNISRLESENYGKQTITSLKRVAEALDVALVVRLVPFSQYIDWLSGTPYLDNGISPEALAVPSFGDEEGIGQYEALVRYHPVYINAKFQSEVAVPENKVDSLQPAPRGVYVREFAAYPQEKAS
jgi:hypothetical protein